MPETYWEIITRSIRDFFWPRQSPATLAANDLIAHYKKRPVLAVPLSSLQTHQMRDAVIVWHRHKTIDAGTAEKFLDLIDEIDRCRKLVARSHFINREGEGRSNI